MECHLSSLQPQNHWSPFNGTCMERSKRQKKQGRRDLKHRLRFESEEMTLQETEEMTLQMQQAV